MGFMEQIKKRASKKNCLIVLPESYDERVAAAAVMIEEQGIARILLLSDNGKEMPGREKLKRPGIEILDYKNSPELEEMAGELYELRKKKGMTREKASALLQDPLYYGAMLVRRGKVDGMVAGACHSTGDTLRPALQILKTAPGVKLVSGFFLMCVPNCDFGDHGTFLFADCGLNQDPTAEELAAIADSSARSFKSLVGSKPIIAMLSHSTKGSAKHEMVSKVVEATRIAHELYPGLTLDGELQLDAALVPSVAKSKSPGSEVAGKANVLIFPNLDAGNIGYKLVQRLGQAEAYGPMLQGIAKPVNDLSRGCSWQDIVGVVALTAVQAQLA